MSIIANDYIIYPIINNIVLYNGTIYVLLFSSTTLALFKAKNGENWESVSTKDITGELPDYQIKTTSLLVDSSGALHIFYVVTGDSRKLYHRTYDNDWGAAELIAEEGDPENSEGPLVFRADIDDNDNLHVSWSCHDPFPDKKLFYRRQLSGVWQNYEVVAEGLWNEWFSMTLYEGSAHFFAVHDILESYFLALAHWEKTGDEWEYEIITSYPADWPIYPSSLMTVDSDLCVLYTSTSEGTGMDLLKFTIKTNNEWAEPQTISSGEADDLVIGSIGKDSEGNIYAVYMRADSLSSAYFKGVYLRKRETGEWQDEEIVEESGDYESFSVMKYNPERGAITAYSLKENSSYITKSFFYEYSGNEIGIFSISPSIGGVNKIVEISGDGFGAQQSDSRVVFTIPGKSYYAEIVDWGNNKIRCYAPEVESIGDYDVQIQIVDNE